jgi:hypothetical protein
MKNKRVLFSALALAILLSACNLKAKRAKEYHDNLLHSVQVVIDSSLEYGDAIQSHDKGRAVRAQQQYSTLVDKTIARIDAAGNFDGDSSLKYYSLELLGFYRTTLDKDFTPFLNSLKSDEFSEEEGVAADSLYNKLTMTENNYWERFDWAEKKFSKQYELSKLEK